MSPASKPVLSTRKVTREFANGAGIRDISFDALDRQVTAVIGPNGAGKTVLFSLITKLMAPDSGEIEVAPDARIAYCPDVPQFEPWLSASEVVEMSRVIAGVSGGIAADEALALCGLTKVRKRRVADFSRGMLQRLGIAAALTLDPEILVLDEPNSALDPIGRADIRTLIAEQRQQRCIILSSHMLSEVEQLADVVHVISDGRLIASGSTNELLRQGLPPAWAIRFAQRTEVNTAALSAAVPGVTVQQTHPLSCTVEFDSFESGSEELPRLISALHAPIVEVTLVGRDLDAAFARMIERQAVA
ncbi:ABC transporter ATP-binding protein [Leucobacter sp. UT-8R-CII-1-4]|uniref:ABC transporter ATP-binding protein n=1 Tax=Leucobacter sp. UT-8R-CII-1-4 TaxID=3040075 RepID=UPI0024A82EE6|nr:ABC transporter ATP-binding protein [Leucobacter sp. UT-8R-CII-1-4]MDI6021957.1 ABC transporter ATP-binding protein [Leucobacter sp. UT-8R-CII-1-4]